MKIVLSERWWKNEFDGSREIFIVEYGDERMTLCTWYLTGQMDNRDIALVPGMDPWKNRYVRTCVSQGI